ncbi:nuclear transport factor 2 family protein [Reyranella sp.]|uniref:nuclear transport factor 2 family protein n=1 Tax=Reyranella sp. TaxID=1929291 RepID=UPI0025DEDE9B|nr:nuclear transport factor 2 family protein [Reyranella sp.]
MQARSHTLHSSERRWVTLLTASTSSFDAVAADIAYEVRCDLGWPRVVRGHTELMDQFLGDIGSIRLRSADGLIVNKADNGRVVEIEYGVHGTILATGSKYENRFCSIIELENRKIVR